MGIDLLPSLVGFLKIFAFLENTHQHMCTHNHNSRWYVTKLGHCKYIPNCYVVHKRASSSEVNGSACLELVPRPSLCSHLISASTTDLNSPKGESLGLRGLMV